MPMDADSRETGERVVEAAPAFASTSLATTRSTSASRRSRGSTTPTSSSSRRATCRGPLARDARRGRDGRPRRSRPGEGAVQYPMWDFRPDVAVRADPATVLADLTDAYESDEGTEDRLARAADRHEALRDDWDDAVRTGGDSITPALLSRAIGEAVEPDVIVVDETVTKTVSVLRHLARAEPGTYYSYCSAASGGRSGPPSGSTSPDRTARSSRRSATARSSWGTPWRRSRWSRRAGYPTRGSSTTTAAGRRSPTPSTTSTTTPTSSTTPSSGSTHGRTTPGLCPGWGVTRNGSPTRTDSDRRWTARSTRSRTGPTPCWT